MELYIAVCEDNPLEQKQLLSLIEDSGISAKIMAFTCGEAFLKEFSTGRFDLIFMDIYLGGMTGVEIASKIRETDESVPIAFTTTSTEFTLESYRLGALKYIEKPVKKKAVQELLEIVRLKKENRPRLLLKMNGKDILIDFQRILYVEQKAHILRVFLAGGEILLVNEKLKNIESQFEEQNFIRCHKSYLVNLAYVKELNREFRLFSMKEGQNVLIRRESMPAAQKALADYLFEKLKHHGNRQE